VTYRFDSVVRPDHDWIANRLESELFVERRLSYGFKGVQLTGEGQMSKHEPAAAVSMMFNLSFLADSMMCSMSFFPRPLSCCAGAMASSCTSVKDDHQHI
jgi:hypothetical protein